MSKPPPSATDPRLDQYIEDAAAFARPILRELRARVRKAAPEASETLKWGRPAFVHRGKILCGFAAFKAHAVFGFWRPDVVDTGTKAADAMWQFGRLTSVDELPPRREFAKLVERALELIETQAPAPKSTKRARPEYPAAPELLAALARAPLARRYWESLAPSHRREYNEWIGEAKREETRLRRVATTLGWLAEGKHKNWKYERC